MRMEVRERERERERVRVRESENESARTSVSSGQMTRKEKCGTASSRRQETQPDFRTLTSDLPP